MLCEPGGQMCLDLEGVEMCLFLLCHGETVAA